jgi:transposase InsO family protein
MHEDLCGPITPVTLTGKRYFFLLIDDVSRYMWLTLLSTEDEAMTVFKEFQVRTEAEVGRKLDTLCTNRDGEFMRHDFLKHCINNGIQRHFTAPHSPEQNGVVERRNQSIMGMARSMMKGMSVPGWLWGRSSHHGSIHTELVANTECGIEDAT